MLFFENFFFGNYASDGKLLENIFHSKNDGE